MVPALALIEQGRLHPELVTSQVVRWDDAAEALAELPRKTVFTREAISAPG
jgi:threonine dehydrogenase-like Zn-dependent dehydrogenase